MKFKVTMKDPDTLHDAITEAVAKEVGAMTSADAEEKAEIAVIRTEKTGELCAKWFRYGEYVTIEIDTEAKTAIVCEAS
jgi:demethoxyubiquinone hydroxylase (CLK1/Coq7/Cat5 family)